MPLTLEQFLAQFRGLIQGIVWNNQRCYRLPNGDVDELSSEMTLRAITWYRQYYSKFQDEPIAILGSLLRKHLRHRAQDYLRVSVIPHWAVVQSLDVPGEKNISNDGLWSPAAEECFQVEDPAQLQAAYQSWTTKIPALRKQLAPQEQLILDHLLQMSSYQHYRSSLKEVTGLRELEVDQSLAKIRYAAEQLGMKPTSCRKRTPRPRYVKRPGGKAHKLPCDVSQEQFTVYVREKLAIQPLTGNELLDLLHNEGHIISLYTVRARLKTLLEKKHIRVLRVDGRGHEFTYTLGEHHD